MTDKKSRWGLVFVEVRTVKNRKSKCRNARMDSCVKNQNRCSSRTLSDTQLQMDQGPQHKTRSLNRLQEKAGNIEAQATDKWNLVRLNSFCVA